MQDNQIEFYYIEHRYIKFLQESGNNGVEHNYEQSENQKPYIGIVMRVNEYYYFAPLSSPKEKYTKIPDSNPTLFKIEKGQQRKLLGVVRLNNMIPAPIFVLNKIRINHLEDEHYKNLLLSQRRIILANADKIKRKAEMIYNLVVNKKNIFYSKLSNDFEKLEQDYHRYIELNHLSNYSKGE